MLFNDVMMPFPSGRFLLVLFWSAGQFLRSLRLCWGSRGMSFEWLVSLLWCVVIFSLMTSLMQVIWETYDWKLQVANSWRDNILKNIVLHYNNMLDSIINFVLILITRTYFLSIQFNSVYRLQVREQAHHQSNVNFWCIKRNWENILETKRYG
jgi:large-conductance mechanosensitive channel